MTIKSISGVAAVAILCAAVAGCSMAESPAAAPNPTLQTQPASESERTLSLCWDDKLPILEEQLRDADTEELKRVLRALIDHGRRMTPPSPCWPPAAD